MFNDKAKDYHLNHDQHFHFQRQDIVRMSHAQVLVSLTIV